MFLSIRDTVFDVCRCSSLFLCSLSSENAKKNAEKNAEADRLFMLLHARFLKDACSFSTLSSSKYLTGRRSLSIKELRDAFVNYLWCMLDDETVSEFRTILTDHYKHDIFDMYDLFYHTAHNSFVAHGLLVSRDRSMVHGIDINPLLSKAVRLQTHISSLEIEIHRLRHPHLNHTNESDLLLLD
jgi:hypothetical protein